MTDPILCALLKPPGNGPWKVLHHSLNPTNDTARAALVQLGLPDETTYYKTCDGSYWIPIPENQ